MHPLLVLRLSGTQAEMGAQHGALLLEHGHWESVFRYYPDMPLNMLLSATRRHPRRERLARAAVRPLMERALDVLDRNRLPAYRERSRAMAEALGQPADLARYLTVMDLFQNTVGLLARMGLAHAAQRAAAAVPPACSSLMVWGGATDDGRLLHARNFDFPGTGVWERAPALVLCTPDEGLRYAFATTRGGDVPTTAFNEAGLTVTAHTRLHRDVTLRGVGITDLCHDIIRRASTLDEAAAVAREHRSASTWGLCVSSARERSACVLELTAGGVEVTRPPDGSAFLASTNRYHHPGLRVDQVNPSAAWTQNCDGRLTVLLRHGRAAKGWGVAELQRALGDHADPATGAPRSAGAILAQPSSVQSVVADLDRGVVHLSVGPVPTGRGRFVEVPLRWDGPAAEERDVSVPDDEAGDAFTEAHRHYVEASRLEQQAAHPDAIEVALRAALALQPDDPDYRFLVGACAARRGNLDEALTHLQAGLEHERSPFSRGQLLLWASRVATRAGRPDLAGPWRTELLATCHPHLGDHHAAALSEQARPGLVPCLDGLPVHVQMVDAG